MAKRKTWLQLNRICKKQGKQIDRLELALEDSKEEARKLWNEKNWAIANGKDDKKRADKADEALYDFMKFINSKVAKDLWTGPQQSPVDRKVYNTPEEYADHITNHRLVVVKKNDMEATMADSILDTVNAAYDSLETPDAAPAPEVVTEAPAESIVETDEQKAERARDEAGRFAKQPKEAKPRETLKLTPKVGSKTPPAPETPNSPGAASPDTQSATQPVAPVVEKIPAPQEWSGLAKVKWDKLPVAVQQEIVQHETARMTATQDLLPVKELVDVNREFLVNQAGSVPEAMRQMMQFARMSVDNPVALAEHILRSKGIDPRQVFAGQPNQAPQQAQDGFQSLQQEVQALREENRRQQQFREQQEIQQLQSTIEQFSADPKRPFFNDVRMRMGQLISAGTAKSLDEAYDQACKLNPAISAHLDEERQKAAETARAAQVQKAQQARRASVTGSPIEGVQAPNGRSKGNVRDIVREAYDELAGG